ncbi:hypothetical protein Tco_0404012 [Tanacetum coccineum]
MENLIQDKSALEERLDKLGSRLYNLENLNIPQKVSKAVDDIVTDAVDWALQAPLRARFKDLPEADMKEILLQRMWETRSYKTHEDHKNLYEALEKSMDCTIGSTSSRPGRKHEEASKEIKSHQELLLLTTTHTLILHRLHRSWFSRSSRASADFEKRVVETISLKKKDQHNQTTKQIRDLNTVPVKHNYPEPAWTISSSNVSDVENNWAYALVSTYEPPAKNLLLAKTGDMTTFMNW